MFNNIVQYWFDYFHVQQVRHGWSNAYWWVHGIKKTIKQSLYRNRTHDAGSEHFLSKRRSNIPPLKTVLMGNWQHCSKLNFLSWGFNFSTFNPKHQTCLNMPHCTHINCIWITFLLLCMNSLIQKKNKFITQPIFVTLPIYLGMPRCAWSFPIWNAWLNSLLLLMSKHIQEINFITQFLWYCWLNTLKYF